MKRLTVLSLSQSSASPSSTWTLHSLVLFFFLLLALLVVVELPTTTVEAFAAVVRRPASSSSIAAAKLLQRAPSATTSTRTATTSSLQLAPMDYYDHAHTLAQTLQATTGTAGSAASIQSQQWIAAVQQPHLSSVLPPPPPPPFLLQACWDAYSRLLREQPVRTKAATAAALCFLGDAVAQLRASGGSQNDDDDPDAEATSTDSYSFRRGLAFAAFGALYTGAFQHHWFRFLQNHGQDWGEAVHLWGHPAVTDIPVTSFIDRHPDEWWQYFDVKRSIDTIVDTLQDPPSPLALAAAKVAVNQFFVIPVVYMPLFFLVTGAVAGLDWNRMQARARSLYGPLLQRNYLFWLPIQTVQFWIVPPDYQVPFVCAASLCWTVVLSSIGGSAAPPASPSSIVAYQKVVVDVDRAQEQPPPSSSDDNDGAQAAPAGGDLPRQEQQPPPPPPPPEPVYQVLSVDAGAANEITDDVSWEDVRDTFVPRDVRDAVGDVQEALGSHPKVGAGAGGLALGLLASAADEAALGATVGAALGASEDLGIAVMAAVGAGAGYLVSQAVRAGEPTEDDGTSAPGVDGDGGDDDKELPVVVVARTESEIRRVNLEVNHANSTSVAVAPTADFTDSVHEQHEQSNTADQNSYAKDHFEDNEGATWEQNNETGSKSNVLTASLKR